MTSDPRDNFLLARTESRELIFTLRSLGYSPLYIAVCSGYTMLDRTSADSFALLDRSCLYLVLRNANDRQDLRSYRWASPRRSFHCTQELVRSRFGRFPATGIQLQHFREDHSFRSAPRLHSCHRCPPNTTFCIDG